MLVWNHVVTGIRLAAIRLALRKPSPNEIPLSGPATKERNYSSVYLRDENQGWRFHVDSVGPKGLNGSWHDRWYLGEGSGWSSCIPKELIFECQLQIVLYVKELELHYASALEFIVCRVTLYPWIQLSSDRISQFVFNRKKLVRNRRIEVLRIFIEETLKRRDFRASASGIMYAIHGTRSARHPDSQKLHQYYIILLDSLVASRDLRNGSNGYFLEPRALSTLAQFEEEDRKHRDQIRMQAILAVLTVGLIVVGVI